MSNGDDFGGEIAKAFRSQTDPILYAAQQEAQKPLDIKSYTKDGEQRATVDIGYEQLNRIMQALQVHSQAVGAMQQRADFLQQQEQRTRQNPILNVLAQLSGNLAAGDKRLPPIVQALGRTSLGLNPGANELARERVDLEGRIATQTEADLRALQSGQIQMAQLALAERGEERRAREEERRVAADKARMEHETRLEQLRAQQIESQERVAASKEASAERRQAEHDRTLLQAAEVRENAMWNRTQAQLAAAEAKARGQTMKLPATLPDKLANLTAAEKALDDMEAGMKKYSAYMGPMAGRTLEPAAAYLKRDVSKFFDKMQLQVAQAIKSTGAGARGFGPMERGFFQQLAESKNHSAQQNLGIIDAWRDYIKQNRAAYLDTYEGLRDPKWKRAFGKQGDELFQGIEGEQQPAAADPLGIR